MHLEPLAQQERKRRELHAEVRQRIDAVLTLHPAPAVGVEEPAGVILPDPLPADVIDGAMVLVGHNDQPARERLRVLFGCEVLRQADEISRLERNPPAGAATALEVALIRKHRAHQGQGRRIIDVLDVWKLVRHSGDGRPIRGLTAPGRSQARCHRGR